jgi:cell division protein FtsB
MSQAMNGSNVETNTLYRNGILVLVLVSIALIVHNIFGQNGFLALRRQQREVQILQHQLQQLQQENNQLDKRNRDLKSNPVAIEGLAREQMHLAKPGEKIYMLPDKGAGNSAAPPGIKATQEFKQWAWPATAINPRGGRIQDRASTL